jgi:hypothetical protein
MRQLVGVLVVVMVGSSGGGCTSDDPEPCYVRDTMTTRDICDMLGDTCGPIPGAVPGLGPMRQIVPADTMAEGVVSQPSHNNLDVIWFENRLFFAFRTSRTHFASRDTVMYIVSTTDHVNWTLEFEFANEWDLREPRFLAFDGKLFFYFAQLGENPISFDPQFALVSEYEGPCGWSEPERILQDEFIPWRTKTIDGVPYMIGYTGGNNIYEPGGEPLKVYWYTTDDGRNFTPVIDGQEVVLEGGTSETDWVIMDNGDLVAIARNEAGDELGWGSKICRADASDLGTWNCVADPKKYDSPLLFRHGQEIYLIGRRNVSEDGHYDLMMRNLEPAEQDMVYQVDYWQKPKRCALWRVDPEAMSVEHVMDLPSAGDTCFAGMVPLNDNAYLIYNYTSPLDDLDISWMDAQLGDTLIYRTTLHLP